ncbi:hypothetical protein ACFFGT_02035 [Mucilaginibacter angelicae]|uniref:SnoaL-like domain-containing protein n=1 Tax=Mucilaginibacter angelicae TaxID=869718 RepID=A0ABV6L0M5_9SPHI
MELTENLKKVTALDRAWNERRWDDYSSFYSDEVVVFINGMINPQNKKDFLTEARLVCELFPDNQVLIDPYINLFASRDESLTCSVAWIMGAKADAFEFGGYLFKPKYCNYAITVVAVRGWRNGKVIMQRLSFDVLQLLSQVSMGPYSTGEKN